MQDRKTYKIIITTLMILFLPITIIFYVFKKLLEIQKIKNKKATDKFYGINKNNNFVKQVGVNTICNN